MRPPAGRDGRVELPWVGADGHRQRSALRRRLRRRRLLRPRRRVGRSGFGGCVVSLVTGLVTGGTCREQHDGRHREGHEASVHHADSLVERAKGAIVAAPVDPGKCD